MEDYFSIDNFFSEKEMLKFDEIILDLENKGLGKDSIPPWGPFKDQLVVNYLPLKNTEIAKIVFNKISPLFPKNIIFNNIDRNKLFLPWDVHADYFIHTCQAGYEPYYTLLIPLNNVNSRTIIFNQTTDGPDDFSTYKETHEHIENPISEEFWRENLSMCWDHDRKYLSLKAAGEYQRRGQLNAFHRKYFHSSDNFHLRLTEPKSFIQVRIDILKDA